MSTGSRILTCFSWSVHCDQAEWLDAGLAEVSHSLPSSSRPARPEEFPSAACSLHFVTMKPLW